MSDKLKTYGAIVTSILVTVIVGAWLLVMAGKLGSTPVVDDKGVVRVDEWERAKEIFSILFPVLSAVVAFWFGNKGAEKANEKANALLEVADEATVARARALAPEAFPGS